MIQLYTVTANKHGGNVRLRQSNLTIEQANELMAKLIADGFEHVTAIEQDMTDEAHRNAWQVLTAVVCAIVLACSGLFGLVKLLIRFVTGW